MIKTGIIQTLWWLFVTLMGISAVLYAAQVAAIKEDMK